MCSISLLKFLSILSDFSISSWSFWRDSMFSGGGGGGGGGVVVGRGYFFGL